MARKLSKNGSIAGFVGVEVFELGFAAVLGLSLYFVWYLAVRYVWLLAALTVLGAVCCVVKAARNHLTQSVSSKGRGVFITGCDTGFGHDLAKRLDDEGFSVFAGCLHEKGNGAKSLKTYCSKRLHVVPLDITSGDNVSNALNYVKRNLPKRGLWCVVNNAGMNVHGDVELVTTGIFHKGINVNLYGPIRVTKAFLPLIRASSGRVVFVSSVLGRFAWPGKVPYTAAKHGMETLADSLRLEMKKFDVKVSIVEPGNYGYITAIAGPQQLKRHSDETEELWTSASNDVKLQYGRRYFERFVPAPVAKDAGSFSHGTGPVIDAMTHAVRSGRPHSRYLVGGSDTYLPYCDWRKALVVFYPLLPSWLRDAITVRISGCNR